MNRVLSPNYRMRRLVAILIVSIISLSGAILGYYHDLDNQDAEQSTTLQQGTESSRSDTTLAIEALQTLEVKGRAPKTNYSRAQFGSGWATADHGCSMRNIILLRDMSKTVVDEECRVQSGVLKDPYTGRHIQFERGVSTSSEVQIDHVVALSNAWQTGAQRLGNDRRISLANDPANLLAVDGAANQQKGDADAATWLPSNKSFRCQYVARQIAVKQLYKLWVTSAEKAAIARVLAVCPDQSLPVK